MELAPNTYYMSIFIVASRASGKALAGKKNSIGSPRQPRKEADSAEAYNRSMEKFSPRLNFGLDHGFMRVSCAAAAGLRHNSQSMLILETREEPQYVIIGTDRPVY
jgi:hypothetical protein